MKISNKTYRTLDFIMGARSPTIQRALSPYGFTPEVLGEGVELLKHATTLRLAASEVGVQSRTEVFARMDARYQINH